MKAQADQRHYSSLLLNGKLPLCKNWVCQPTCGAFIARLRAYCRRILLAWVSSTVIGQTLGAVIQDPARWGSEVLYRAFTDPAALAVWQAPGDMTGKVHSFDYRVGGGYQMSLYYPSSETTSRGKTEDREDRYTARFVELTPPRKIVEAITFDTVNPAFKGEMIMEATFEAENGGTTVSLFFKGIPSGVRPEDNEAGTQSSLEKLARYVEEEAGR